MSWTADYDTTNGEFHSSGHNVCVSDQCLAWERAVQADPEDRRWGTSHQYSAAGTRVRSGQFTPGNSTLSVEDHRRCSLLLKPFSNCTDPLCFQVYFILGFFFFNYKSSVWFTVKSQWRQIKFRSSTCPSHFQTLPTLVRLPVLGVTPHWASSEGTSLPHCFPRSWRAQTCLPYLFLLTFCHVAGHKPPGSVNY